MIKRILFSLSAVMLLSGCETLQTPQQRREAQAREAAKQRQAEERAYRMQGQVESVEIQNERLMQELSSLRSQIRSQNSQISSLNSKMASLEAKQSREMNELIKRVEGLLKKSMASRPSSSSKSTYTGNGVEHIVKSGHTLSTIAQAYGSSVKAIKAANNLKSDNIYVGQKLIIPQ
jgi:LysM repeat protein